MDDLTISIDTAAMEKALTALPRKLAGRIAKEALAAAGDVMLESMVALAPERTDEPTPGSDSLPPGILKADLTTQVIISNRYGARVKVGPTEIAGHVARFIEEGWDLTTRGGKKGKGGRLIRHIDGKHFMSGAFDESAERAVDVLLEHIATALDQDSGADQDDELTSEDEE